MEIKKIEKSDFVMFPRMQHRGLEFRHVERDAFKAELRHVEGHSDYWLVHQQSKPHVVAHVQLPKTEAEFDNILGWCLGQNHWCEYIEGDLSFLCIIAGFNAAELTPSTQSSSVSASMPSAMLLAGGMSMERNVAMHLPCPCNKSFQTYLPVSLLLCAFGTAASRKVACRLLHENDTALSALNLYWRVGVGVLDFRIVELLPMHPLCFLDKQRCRFALVGHNSIRFYNEMVQKNSTPFHL